MQLPVQQEFPFLQQEDKEWLSLLVDNILKEVENHKGYPQKRKSRNKAQLSAYRRRRRKKQEDIRLQELPFVF